MVTVDTSYRTGMDLTDQQWTIIEPLFEEKRLPDGRGRPWLDARAGDYVVGPAPIRISS